MEKRHCRVPAGGDARSTSGRGSFGSTDAHQDWANVFPLVLDLAKQHLSKEEASVFLRSGHLVNHHWSSWAVGAARCLVLEIGAGDGDQKLMGVVNRFTALESVTFARTPGLGDARLLPLQRLSQLRSLAVRNFSLFGSLCAAFTDVGLAHIGAMTTLVDLDLSSCSSISDRGVAELCHLTNLKRLSLLGCRNVTEAGMAHLAVLRSLADLDLRSCGNGVSDTGVGYLGTMPSLTRLAICSVDNGISGKGGYILGTMTGLVSLDIAESVRNRGLNRIPGVLQFISNLINLTELHLPPTRCTLLQSLGALTALSALALWQCPEPDIYMLNVLKQWRHLSRLELHSSAWLSSYDCNIIGDLTDLVRLALSFPSRNTSQDGLTWLSNLLALETLELRNVTREGSEPDGMVQSLRPLTRLRKLELSGSTIRIGRFMCFLTCLVELDLHSNFFTGDCDLKEFTKLTALTRLDLGMCEKVTDEGLISLGVLSKLAYLDLRYTAITDAGLQHLLPLRFLRHVCLDGCSGLSHSYGGGYFGLWRRTMKEMP